MNRLRYILINVLQTLLRMLPFPCKTGLIKIGKPDRNSPVLLTGNFRLTVERVTRSIEGMDAYLLVANSRGVNVWCAATGGMLTNHDVVSVLKTSGIEDLVDHRTVMLPQLAATGIEGRAIQHKAGWKVIWGPVRACVWRIVDFQAKSTIRHRQARLEHRLSPSRSKATRPLRPINLFAKCSQ